MPFYNYTCKKCGVFEEWQSMSRSSLPMACTSCGKRSKRAISMPNISMVDTYQRIAHQRNEKSADQPEMITKGPKEHGGHSHGHGGHNHGHKHAHSHGPSRPWMIGH
jgi:putative FmdB family regulatory protein